VKKILVVEDDPRVLGVTSMILEIAGYEVVQTNGAEEVLAMGEGLRDIDLMLTDVNLKHGLNGIELAREIRTRGYDASVIVVSGDLLWADTQLDEGMAFLAKPYDRQTLLSAIERAGSGN
jgi:CheY-like chemotaxis protein